MIRILARNFLRFLFLVLFQVLILNNIVITDLGITPYLYILFIILLPFETPGWITLIIAFFLGLSVDFFSDTYGLHAASCVFMTFTRPLVLELNAPREGYESGTFPRIHFYGFNWFFKYAFLLVFFHHLFFFFVEAFSFQNILITMGKVALSTIFTTFLIVFSQYLIYQK